MSSVYTTKNTKNSVIFPHSYLILFLHLNGGQCTDVNLYFEIIFMESVSFLIHGWEQIFFSREIKKKRIFFLLLWGFFSEQYYFPFPLCAYYTFICNIYTSINPYNSICIILPFNRQEGWMSETLYIIIHPGNALWAILC